MADINPSPEEVAMKVPMLREKFEKKFKDKLDGFDKRDVERLRSDDAFARCYLRTLKSDGDIDKALDVVADSFKWRKEIGLHDLTESSFPAEILDRKAMYYKGQDKQGHPILYLLSRENTASGAEEVLLLKKYIAFKFNEHHSKNPEQMCVVLMDMTGAGTGNMNMDITKYVIQCFTTNFPAFLAYSINYEMPSLLSGLWKVISAFLNKNQTKKILMLRKKDMDKYIAPDNLWPHMKD